ncbi:MAG: DUF465 domain-containing protein [Ancalomicrobiaceae bacterium]|nr:DUF465 domain-containing protein [Ancalomicrobiaceae bacterium]
MSIESHLAELERRHAALDGEIRREAASPAIDSLKIAELKRRKLVLKDEISRLRHDEETLH